jgi:hypothetical protein
MRALLLLLALGSVAAEPEVPVFDVHFAVITARPEAARAATHAALRREVSILNRRFVDAEGRPVVRFRFKAARVYDEVRGSSCRFAALGDSRDPYDSDGWAEAFNECDDPKVRDPRAINFYVYDSDGTCHGKRNSGRPYVLIDWARLGHQGQSPEEHEMGHAFGLDHVCAPGAEMETSTNIMASAECGKGSGGRRDLGFTPEQVSVIRERAAQIARRLRGE